MGCLKRVVGLLLLLVVLAAVFLFRDRLRDEWRELRGQSTEPAQPSEQLANEAATKLDALRDGSARSATLSAVELESLLLYRYRGVLPAFLDSPRIELDGDQLRLRGRVPVEKIPNIEGLGDAATILPDTTELAVEGRLLPLSGGRIAFAVDGVSAAKVPLPGRLIPKALERLGRRDEPGLPRDAMALPLPSGIAGAYIRRDSLVLVARDSSGN